MGESLTVQCFRNGEIAKFPRAIAWDIFEPYARPAAFSGWDLSFPDGSRCHLHLDDDNEVDGFGINRPCGSVFALVYSVLSKVPAIMIVSSDGFCCVADEKVLEGIPDWLRKALPVPVIVSSGPDIGSYFVSAEDLYGR